MIREAAAVILVLSIAAALVIALGAKTRASAGLNRDLGNLRQVGQLTIAYATDSDDRAPALDEAPNSQWPELHPDPRLSYEVVNAAHHAIDIIRRLSGRHEFPQISLWNPWVYYNSLVLADHANRRLPDRLWVASGDVHRMNWTDDPEEKHDQGFWQPFQEPQHGGAPQDGDKRWPFSSSYQLVPALYDAGQSEWQPGTTRMYQHQNLHNACSIPSDKAYHGQPMSRIAYPSQKVMWHDYADWYHAATSQYFAAAGDRGAQRVSSLVADGSAGARPSRDANPGWHPATPAHTRSQPLSYQPRDWEPRTTNGQSWETLPAGYYRWTRGGLKGRDFGGTEINTGQR